MMISASASCTHNSSFLKSNTDYKGTENF